MKGFDKMKVVLLHGLGQNSKSFNKTAACINVGHTVLCPELRSFIRKGKAVEYCELYKGFSEYCLSDLNSEPIGICGGSLGGILAMQYALENPDKVKFLVLVGTQYIMPKALLKLQNFLFRFMPDKMFDDIGFKKSDFISLSKSMMNLDFSKSLNDIHCPVSIVCGEKDRANRNASEQMKKFIPNSRFVLVKTCGHEVNLDAPYELGKEINGLLNGLA